MKSLISTFAAFTAICLLYPCWTSCAQDSAPSSHLVFDDNFDGDIIINEVRVPKSGEATYTYYEALGWRGKGAGYAGIQADPKAHLYIFSIWDNKSHTAPIKAVHRGPGTKVVGFGGEGTGLKSWNFDLGWRTDVWYTLIARTWPVGDHTHYGFWVRAGDTKQWTHLVTMDVAADAVFKSGTDAFIEDWLSTGEHARTTNLRGGWKRRTDGTWFPFGAARYSVNAWELDPGKRSYNFRTNWNGGVDEDASGKFYFMTSGGAETDASVENPSVHNIARKLTEPDYGKLKIEKLSISKRDDKSLIVSWQLDRTTIPQFSYRLSVFSNDKGDGEPLLTMSSKTPHANSATLDVSALDLESGTHYLHLVCTDILDRSSDAKVTAVTGSSPAG